MLNIQTVTVVGANGTMGCNVSAIFASFGAAKVFMVSRELAKAQSARSRAVLSVRADSIAANLVAADYSQLEECVAQSDLVFESTAEKLEVKLAVTRRIAESLREDAVACSGTSGLSITTLAECFPEAKRKHYFGVHMFNPPYSMILCEFTPTKYSDPALARELQEYLHNILHRTVVEVKDSPAFLGNRIGFQFISEAMQCAETYKDNGGIDYIDAILGPFTGRAMAPLATANFVGLDVHQAIVENLHENTNDYAHDTFLLPEFAKYLIENKMLGRKSGGGLYKRVFSETGVKSMMVFDLNERRYRPRSPYFFPFAEAMKSHLRTGDYDLAFASLLKNQSLEAQICVYFLLNYVVYALTATEQVGYQISAADDVMATGFKWCPPLAMLQAFARVTEVPSLLRSRLPKRILDQIDLEHLLRRCEPSRYDYRPFFKAIRN